MRGGVRHRLGAFGAIGALALAGCGESADQRAAEPRDDASAGAAGGGGGASGVGGASGAGGAGTRRCNGHAALCERRFDEVALPGTHNAHSAREYGFSIAANQESGIAKQLEDGVRVLLMDVYEDQGETVLCHGPCAIGRTPHLDRLLDLRVFLEASPDEVVAIIYEDHVDANVVEADFSAAGLVPYTYAWAGGTWPTLGELIDAGTRLVVMAESGGPPPAWYHPAWDLAWDTPYTFHAVSEFSCELNRGSESNPLYLVNHWMNTAIDLPSEANAEVVNAYDVLHARLEECRAEAGRIPSFVAVDFYEKGELFRAVDALNGL